MKTTDSHTCSKCGKKIDKGDEAVCMHFPYRIYHWHCRPKSPGSGRNAASLKTEPQSSDIPDDYPSDYASSYTDLCEF